MAHCERASKPLLQCLRSTCVRVLPCLQAQWTRGFHSTTVTREERQTEAKELPFSANPDPRLVSAPHLEKKIMRQGVMPIGSRRRRAALQDSPNVPFEQLPYQCFQEARKILLDDRQEKLKELEKMSQRLARLLETQPQDAAGEKSKKSRVGAMKAHIERLKIFADINDPMVKKKFEDGQGRGQPNCP